MSDPRVGHVPAGQQSPIPPAPAEESPRTSEPPVSSAAILDQFSRWLERWAVYARACLVMTEAGYEGKPVVQEQPSPMDGPLPREGPPAHWQAAVTQGPPAHWLALFAGQPEEASAADEPGAGPKRREAVQPPAAPELPDSGSPASLIGRFQAELTDFLGASLPDSIQTQGEAHHAPLDEAASVSQPQAGEPTGSEAPLAPDPSSPPGLAPGVQANRPDAPRNNPTVDSTPASIPHSGDALSPARITRLRLRPPLARGAPPAEAKSGPPPGLRASDAISPEPGDRDNLPAPGPILAAAGEPTPQPTAPRVTRLRLSGPLSNSPVGGSLQFASRPPHPAVADAASPPGASLPGLKIGINAPQTGQSSAPAASPTDFVLPVATQAPEPVWPPRTEQAEPLATRWPAAVNDDHWPALPEPQPWHDPGPRPYQDQARRRRIDREQGGGSWKG